MTTPVRRRLRLARRGAWYGLAGLLVLMALAAGIASQLLPLVERHPQRIAAWLSARAQQPVTFEHVETAWTRRGPLLRVDGLRIGTGATAVPIGEAEILVSQYAGLLPGRSFTELRLRGLELVLERHDDGRWQVRGLPGQPDSDADPLDVLQRLGELQVIDGRLTVVAPALGIDTTLPRVDLRVRMHGDRVRAAARGWIGNGAAPLHGVLDLDRRTGNGRVHLALVRDDLAAWAPLLRAGGLGIVGGTGRAGVWADLRGHRIVQVTLDADLQSLRLRGTVQDAQAASPRDTQDMLLSRIQARARWQLVAGGWRLDAPLLRLQDASGNDPARLDGLVIAGGARRALLAREIDAAPLLALAALSDHVPPGLRAWLRDAQPGGRLRDVVVVGHHGGPLRARARIDDFHFVANGDAPGVSGVAGTLQGDSEGMAFAFDPRQALRFDWPRGFGVPHEVVVRGRLVGWRTDGGWQLQSPELRIDGTGYGALVRGGLGFEGDGTPPEIELAVALDDAAIATARRFWVRHKMPEATVKWLDGALLGGRVHNGRALLSGNLDDWPFASGNGVFRAEADLVEAVVLFDPHWPAARHLNGQVVFAGDGFRVSGRAALADIPVTGLEARIPHFGSAQLAVRAESTTDASKLLSMLRQSPLREAHGETLQALQASGVVKASFELDLPLHAPGGRARLGGNLDLRGARLADSRWDLALTDVRGQARYDQAGFTAERLAVSRGGQPGILSLRAGAPHVRVRGQAFEAELVAALSAADLLQRAPQLSWLQPHVSGRSTWTTRVSIPVTAPVKTAPESGRLQMSSDLVGTRLALPAPMDKPASMALPTTIETRLPVGEGEIAVALGSRMALRAGSRQGRTGVRVVLGQASVAEPPPAHGLVATGHAAVLDAIGWATLVSGPAGSARGGGPGGEVGSALPLQRIDLSADRLQMAGAAFPQTRVRALPASGGVALQFTGAALAGSLMIAQADGGMIAGRLRRLYWPIAQGGAMQARPAGEAIAAPAGGGVAPGDTLDPARIPPLNLVVDDLRFGDVALGSASLQTRRTASGLQVERLQARTPGQRIEASGDWTGRGVAARTRLQVSVESEDFGGLLTGFGFGGRIDGGQGMARFDAAWPGSPAQFRVEALQGALALTMKDGRLVEIEPGAGRVLGLLSLAELPRRLTLDFRDFFDKGFAFNRIDGQVQFGDGKARTQDLAIEGPAAEIRIRGSADLRAQTYDQTIEVLPRTGNLLAAVGAITAGPIGAAVGAVANAVLQKPLGEINAKVYRVTGPWKDPKVQASSRAQAQEQPSAADAAPPG